MHPDLPRLLELQSQDEHLASLAAQRRAVLSEVAALEATLDRHNSDLASTQRTARDFGERRDLLAKKLETQKAAQEKRRERLEQERNPRVAAQAMADLEMARGVLAQEESDWLRLAEEVGTREAAVTSAEARLAEAREAQAPQRGEFDAALAGIDAQMTAAKAARETTAGTLDKALRTRYDRLRGSRKNAVVVPVERGACTGCYTALPSSRLGPLQTDGVLFEGCQMCGAIIYLATAVP